MKRKVLFLLLLLSLAGMAWLVFLSWVPRTPWSSPPEVTDIRPRATATAEEGKVIVTAIYEFKNRHGLWPSCMAELVPDYLSAETVRGWHYTWKPSGGWYLTNYIAFPHWAVRYERRPDAEGWQLTDGMDGTDLGITQPKPPLSALPEEDLLNNLGVLMRRRMAAEPGKMLHYQGQISWLYRRDRWVEARQVCLRCLEVWPDHWWPNLMLGILDARLGLFEEAEQRLIRFTEKRADFNHAFLLAHFYFTVGEADKGFVTLKKATKLPMRDLTDGMASSDQPFGMMAYHAPWEAAVMAYRAKRYDVAVAVCDRWERYYQEESPAADQSFYTIRAACHLALEEFDRAQAQAAEADRVGKSRRLLTENVDKLLRAIERRDIAYVHDMGDFPPFTLLLDYE